MENTRRISLLIFSCLLVFMFVGASDLNAGSKLTVEFADPAWDGKKIPKGQHCKKPHGGNGSSPPLRVSNIPPEANAIVVEFNDRNFQPMSYNGGHGILGFEIEPGVGSVVLPPVLGGTKDMPEGVWLVKRNSASESNYREDGYKPPCSGGRGNKYEAIIYAVKMKADFDPSDSKKRKKFKKNSKVKLVLGRY